jgi:conjugative relaxase-like TrwC/TraI family protein
MMTVRRMRLGSGFRYLMESVAAGDGGRRMSTELTRYYAESGTPTGVFLGAGLAGLGGGRGITAGATVTEEQLWRMLGVMADPLTGEPLGTVPRAGSKIAAVAGFDFTFSPSKSVSTAWALGDNGTRRVIYACHRRAIEFVLAYAEREVFHSRSGTNGIVQEDIEGVIAAAFTHWDNRAGDPQLHDHVVVWNRACSRSDGQWRTLDSRGLYKAVVALSEMHQGVLSDYLTQALGVGWEARARRHSERPRWEIAGVPEALLAEFSQRNEQVEAHKDRMVTDFVSALARQPTGTEVMDMRRRATVLTRPKKEYRSLGHMTTSWSQRAARFVGEDAMAWVASLKDRNDLPLLHARELADEILADAARAVTYEVAERRSVYSRANLLAETHRILQGVRFAGPEERVAAAERIVDLAVDASLDLSAPSIHHVPDRFRRADGTSRLRPKGYETYTTRELLEAEARLLDHAHHLDGPGVSRSAVAAVAEQNPAGRDFQLSLDQGLAVETIATSGRRLDVLVGPAGTGKSTTMAGLRAAWEAEHGPGSVIGLAPSAGAAEVLGEQLGIVTENTAKWLTEHRRIPGRISLRNTLAHQLASYPHGASRIQRHLAQIDAEIDRWRLRADQLVIVDEASLAGTFALDQLVTAAADAGAKVLLTGDWAQLSGVEAGGAFALLARDRGDRVPALSDVRRFQHEWEKHASVGLRLGHETALDAYEQHGRIVEGERDEILDALYQAWQADIEAGRSSLMIAGDAATVAELNRRARAGRIASRAVISEGVPVADGETAGIGDLVVTRQNERRLWAGGRWVKNGDHWTVTGTRHDGAMTVTRTDGCGELLLPASYVAVNVELAYASTAHRAQGRTVDTSHTLVAATTTREVLYVAATRGCQANRLYVDVAYDPDPATGHDQTQPTQNARQVLAAVLANEGADVSAHETVRRAQHAADSWTTLHAEYQTLAATAQADRWDALISRSGLTPIAQKLVNLSPARGALYAALREAEASGLNVDTVFPALARGGLEDANDPTAVLHSRVQQWIAAAQSRADGGTHLIAGLVPGATGVRDPDMSQGLAEREHALEQRARYLAVEALSSRHVWVRRLGQPPADPTTQRAWLSAIGTVAAYRERWSIGRDPRLLGSENVQSLEQLAHMRRAKTAIEIALAAGRLGQSWQTGRPGLEVHSAPEPVRRGPDL